MKQTRIIFLGTSTFAVPILEKLSKHFEIVLVVSQPDEKVGRKQVLSPPPVKLAAEKMALAVYQPAKVNTDEVLEKLAGLKPDYLVVAAYGQILKKALLEIPQRACLNAHASLLPQYRGASPIQTALLNRDLETGMTIMQVDEGLDTGPIIKQAKLAISPDDDYFSLESRLAKLAAEMLVEVVAKDHWQAQAQDETKASHSRIFQKADGLLDFKQSSAEQLEAKIRAFAKWPQCFTMWNGKRLKILKAEVLSEQGIPAQVSWNGEDLKIACFSGSLVIQKLQLEGKAVQEATSFMRGYPNFAGAVL